MVFWLMILKSNTRIHFALPESAYKALNHKTENFDELKVKGVAYNKLDQQRSLNLNNYTTL